MQSLDSISIMPQSWRAPDTVFSTDSCLTGCGGWCENSAFHTEFPKWIMNDRNVSIYEKEMLAVILAVKKWGNVVNNLNLLAYCDNSSTMDIINKGSANNIFAQKCLRELCYCLAKRNAVIKMVYLTTKQNRISDLLSRWNKSESRDQFF